MLPNKKTTQLIQVLSSKENRFWYLEERFLAQVGLFTPHENTDGKGSIFI